MEACSGAHDIGRQLQALGHDVRLIPAQYVKPFLKLDAIVLAGCNPLSSQTV
jgi:transposase